MKRPSSTARGPAPEKPAEKPPAPRRSTINDVARLAGVSKKTVSRVINQSPFVKEETRQRIHELMRELSYEPDPQARGLAFRRSFLIGLIYDNPNAQFVVNAQQGVLDGVRGSGFEVVVHPCNRQSKTFLADVAGFVQRQKLFGVVVLPPISEDNKLKALLEEKGCRYVRIASAPVDAPPHLMMSNDREACAEAAVHLARLGHKRIALIAGPPGFRSRKERRDGFVEGLRAQGLDLPSDLIIDGAYTYESGMAAAKILLTRKPRPTAIFASNDEMAAGVYRIAQDMNIGIPDDLSVVGFDDMPISSRLQPPLTTVHWPLVDMGRAAAAKLVRSLGEARPEDGVSSVPSWLVVRESTAPPPR
ncbi:MAG TPA: LacI family DNA-binding transcriptional regulator [Caulobacterales bacterium]|nr:LacI family DNA-binding transcriptional regulator [Caulobacterales bacterium]